MMKKMSLIFVLLLLFSLFAAGCGGSEPAQEEGAATEDTSLADIQEKGHFVLGLDDAFPPMGFRGESGEIEGFDIDVANAVAERMGVEVQLQPIDWNAKDMEMENRNIDVIWNGFTITAEREEIYTFSQPYLANSQAIVVQAGSAIDTKADLAGKKVGVQLDSSGQKAIESDTATLESLGELLKFDTYTTAMLDLKNGTIDAVVGDVTLVGYVMSKDPGVYKIASENFGEEFYGIGFRKEDKAFAAEVDRIINEMIADGTAAELSVKWFGEDIFYVPGE